MLEGLDLHPGWLLAGWRGWYSPADDQCGPKRLERNSDAEGDEIRSKQAVRQLRKDLQLMWLILSIERMLTGAT